MKFADSGIKMSAGNKRNRSQFAISFSTSIPFRLFVEKRKHNAESTALFEKASSLHYPFLNVVPLIADMSASIISYYDLIISLNK